MGSDIKHRAPRNRTIELAGDDVKVYKERLFRLDGAVGRGELIDRVICQDVFEVLDCLEAGSVDLIFADPPYNLAKTFNGRSFSQRSQEEYEEYLGSWVGQLARILKDGGSIYICGDWRSSGAIHRVASKYFTVRGRITWERDKGRGAKKNWKNCSEDIWFCTVGDDYQFDVEAVKLKRRVMAPYTHQDGEPKDWQQSGKGRFRQTHPSNIWTDITVPFWSMPENTDHPTQKPEKLLAKLILASSREGDVVFDPFGGVGTTAVVAKKLKRHFICVEIDEGYCCLAEKRLAMAEADMSIQGYEDGYFWERNSLAEQKKEIGKTGSGKVKNVKC